MKTKNSIDWYVNGDNNVMIATDRHGRGWRIDVTYSALTREDLITMLETLDPDVNVLSSSELETKIANGAPFG
jgi:hypothetical protein